MVNEIFHILFLRANVIAKNKSDPILDVFILL